MSSEAKYHETIWDRVAAEGWCVAVLYPALGASVAWTLFLVVLYWVSSAHRPVPLLMLFASPLIGVVFGFLGAIVGATWGRDLVVAPKGYVCLRKNGRTHICEPLTRVASAELTHISSERIAIEITFQGPRQRVIRFCTKCTSGQEMDLMKALTGKAAGNESAC
jgi:hypothetical protein